MKLCVITKDDEPIYDEKLLRRNGYTDIERCPVVPSDGMTKADPVISRFVPKRDLIDAERSLSLSWANMLLTHLDDPDDTMFCESDVSPKVTANAMSGLLASISNKYDVFRPFIYLNQYNVAPPQAGTINVTNFKTIPFRDDDTARRMLGSAYVAGMEKWKYAYGTHVLIIPRHARRKVASIFRRCILPCDLALYLMSVSQQLETLTALCNLFVQAPHESSIRKKSV